MTEQQEKKDWLDKLIAFFKNPNKDIAYSIRKRGKDEIEIRASIFDGYARGLIRFILCGMMLISIFNGSSFIPFYSHSDTTRDYQWAFDEDKRAMPQYLRYKEGAERRYKVALEENDPFVTPPYHMRSIRMIFDLNLH